MNILVVGSGGREHALAWKLAQPERVDTVFVAPGNAGTHREPGLSNVDIDVMDFEGLADFAGSHGVGLTVIGPEAPLCGGIVDYFSARGLACFGPSKAAAQLEGSKAFINKEGPDPGIPASKVGQPQSQREAHQEAFTT